MKIAEVNVNSFYEAYFITQNIVDISWSFSKKILDTEIFSYFLKMKMIDGVPQKHRSTMPGDRLICAGETFEVVGLGFNKIPVKEEKNSSTSTN